MEYLEPGELARIEREYARACPRGAILEIFRPKGVRLSEATFRKYVQAGLLPRSRRVGRKGKHRGSQGLYPVEAVRRINAIKKMMAEGLTLEDIRRSFVFFKNHIDQVEREPGRGARRLRGASSSDRAFGDATQADARRASSATLRQRAPRSWCGTSPGWAARSPHASRSQSQQITVMTAPALERRSQSRRGHERSEAKRCRC